jgi:hypothetical protein
LRECEAFAEGEYREHFRCEGCAEDSERLRPGEKPLPTRKIYFFPRSLSSAVFA